jgi:hypothetical protein
MVFNSSDGGDSIVHEDGASGYWNVPTYNLRAVALHELGHAIGLNHPDKAGQIVLAMMNSIAAHGELQLDDIAGARALYGLQDQVAINPGAPDFNGDGQMDMVLHNQESGQVKVVLGNGGQNNDPLNQYLPLTSAVIASADPHTWRIVATADMNGDGKSDLILVNLWTNTIGVWYMSGTSMIGSAILRTLPPNWFLAGVADMDNDGKADLILRNRDTGVLVVSFVSGPRSGTYVNLGTIPLSWELIGIGDFDGDGWKDLLWKDRNSNSVAVWLMRYIAIKSTAIIGNVGPYWHLVGIDDLDGDGKDDIVWQNEGYHTNGPVEFEGWDDGKLAYWYMNGTKITKTDMQLAGVVSADGQSGRAICVPIGFGLKNDLKFTFSGFDYTHTRPYYDESLQVAQDSLDLPPDTFIT